MTKLFCRAAAKAAAISVAVVCSFTASALELSGSERAYVAHKLVAGEKTIGAYFATQPGRSGQMAQRLKKADGKILLLAEDIDVLYVEIDLDRLADVLQWKEWTAVELDGDGGHLTSPDRELSVDTPKKKRPGPAPSAFTLRDNPYTAEAATESLQFKQNHPTYDGRGTVIGGIEPVDMRTPSMQTAYSLKGARVPKFFDYVAIPTMKDETDPLPPDNRIDYGWQKTAQVERGADGQVSFGDHNYPLPELANKGSGELRMAYVRSPALNYSMGAKEFVVLWAVPERRVWVYERDPNEEQAKFRSPINFEVISAEPNRPAMAQLPLGDVRTMMVSVDAPTKSIRLRAGSMTHGTMCASVAAGSGFYGSQAEGVAPGAQWFAADYSARNSKDGNLTQLMSWLMLYRNPKVDVLTNSTVYARTRQWVSESRALNGQLFERLQRKYPKPHFRAASNAGPSEDFFSEYPKASSHIIAVGAYTPREAWQANFGITPTNAYTMAPYSSYGPAFDGALKPDLLGLTGTLSAAKQEWVDDGASAYFETEKGYFISGGTSAATPNAAGHGSLLISAAKQAGIPHDLPRLKMAMFSTAKFMDGIEARVQGHGLIQVEQAWQALVKLKNYTPAEFVTQAPVRTPFSDQLTPAHTGRGLYERVGWGPNQSGDREITLMRTSGPKGAVKYRLQWKGDVRGASKQAGRHEVFSSSLTEISLPLNTPVKLPVHIQVGESGSYSALVQLVDPSVGLVAHSVMCTIIAAEPLDQRNNYTHTVTREVPRPGHGIIYVNVPEGASGLRVEVKQRDGKNVTVRAINPEGRFPIVGMGKDYKGSDATTYWMLGASSRETYDHTFAQPMPGVWQLWMTHDGGLPPSTYDPEEQVPAKAAQATFKVSVIGLQADPEVQANEGQPVPVAFTNKLIDVQQAKIDLLGVGAARDAQPVLPRGVAPVVYEIDVPAGTSRLTAEVEPLQNANVTLGLGIFYMTDKKDEPASRLVYDISPGSRKSVQLPNPKPGRYKIAVDAWGDVPAQGLKVRYRDILFHPLYGKQLTTDTETDLKSGQRKQADVRFQVGAYPTDGRRLLAEMGLFAKSYAAISMPSDYAERQKKADEEGKPPPPFNFVTDAVPLATQIVLLPKR